MFNMGQCNSHRTEHAYDLATCIDVSLPVVMNVNIDRTRHKIAKRLMVSSFTQLSCINWQRSLGSQLLSTVDQQKERHVVLIRKREGLPV
jgi:hypothetical protein